MTWLELKYLQFFTPVFYLQKSSALQVCARTGMQWPDISILEEAICLDLIRSSAGQVTLFMMFYDEILDCRSGWLSGHKMTDFWLPSTKSKVQHTAVQAQSTRPFLSGRYFKWGYHWSNFKLVYAKATWTDSSLYSLSNQSICQPTQTISKCKTKPSNSYYFHNMDRNSLNIFQNIFSTFLERCMSYLP